jgi:hypothetical protein
MAKEIPQVKKAKATTTEKYFVIQKYFCWRSIWAASSDSHIQVARSGCRTPSLETEVVHYGCSIGAPERFLAHIGTFEILPTKYCASTRSQSLLIDPKFDIDPTQARIAFSESNRLGHSGIPGT